MGNGLSTKNKKVSIYKLIWNPQKYGNTTQHKPHIVDSSQLLDHMI